MPLEPPATSIEQPPLGVMVLLLRSRDHPAFAQKREVDLHGRRAGVTGTSAVKVNFTLLSEGGVVRTVQDTVTANGRYSMDVAIPRRAAPASASSSKA